MGFAHTRLLLFFSRRFFSLGVQTYSLRSKKTPSSSKSGSPRGPVFREERKEKQSYNNEQSIAETCALFFSRVSDGLRPYPIVVFLFSAFFLPRRTNVQPSVEENAVFLEIRQSPRPCISRRTKRKTIICNKNTEHRFVPVLCFCFLCQLFRESAISCSASSL